MDIQRDEAFEEAYAETYKPIIRRPYPRNQNGEYVYKEIYEAHLMWQQAQKVAVPEGFVLVEKDSLSAIAERIEKLFEEDSLLALGELLPIQQDLKAMIEAQEQVG